MSRTENHKVTVTLVPNDETDDVEYTVDHCPGTTCSVWYECDQCSEYEPTKDEDDAGEYDRHNRHHERIDGWWMTDTSECAIVASDSGADGMFEIALEAGLGTHDVDVDYWGDGAWDITLIKPKEVKP